MKPWSAENPTLYQLNVSLINDSGQYLESFDFNVGFRRVEINNRELKVNGATILIRGVNRHDHNPDSGRVLSRAQMREDLLQMKRHNINAVEPVIIQTMMLFMICATNWDYTWWTKLTSKLITTTPDSATSLCGLPTTRGQRMVERDKNHPSIIMWSMGRDRVWRQPYGNDRLDSTIRSFQTNS